MRRMVTDKQIDVINNISFEQYQDGVTDGEVSLLSIFNEEFAYSHTIDLWIVDDLDDQNLAIKIPTKATFVNMPRYNGNKYVMSSVSLDNTTWTTDIVAKINQVKPTTIYLAACDPNDDTVYGYLANNIKFVTLASGGSADQKNVYFYDEDTRGFKLDKGVAYKNLVTGGRNRNFIQINDETQPVTFTEY